MIVERQVAGMASEDDAAEHRRLRPGTSSPVNLWPNIELIATEFFSTPCILALAPLKHIKSLGR